MTDSPTRVAYIGGWGRSGSTLLALMLAQIDNVVSPGELRFVWKRGVLGNELCGCGAPFLECPFWNEVGRAAYGGWSPADAHEMIRFEREAQKLRLIPRMSIDWWWERVAARYEDYLARLGQLYAGLRDVAGARLIVDSTKDEPYAFLLNRVPTIDLSVLHLVRDSRAVAYSWTRTVRRPEIVTSAVLMDRHRPAHSALRWLTANLLFGLLGRRVPYRLVHYERLVRDTADVLARILDDAGLDSGAVARALSGRGELLLGPAHTVSGNPVRFRTGVLAVTVDDEWRRAMPARERAVVTALTWPLLQLYGYFGRDTAASGATDLGVAGTQQTFHSR